MTLQKPFPLFLLGFGITTIYIPGVLGASVPTGWFLLFIVMPLIAWSIKFEFSYGFLLICYATLSLLWTENFNIGFFLLLQMIALGLVYCLGKSIKDPKPVFIGLALGLGISGVIAILQKYFEFKFVFVNGIVAGLFVNPNVFSETSVVILLCLLVSKLYWWIPVTLPGILIVHSRTGLLALGVGLFTWLFNKNRYFALLSLLGVALLSTIFYWNSFSISSIIERFDLWKDTIKGFSVRGNGIGSFEILFPNYAVNIDTSVARPRYAHNDLLQLIFDLGVGSVFILPLLWIKIKNEYSPILYGIGIVASLSFAFHMPALAFIGCLVAGFANRGHVTNRNFGIDRGSSVLKRAKR